MLGLISVTKYNMFYAFLVGAYGVRCVQGPISMISTGFNESHFEFRVNQELYGFYSVIIGFFIQKNMVSETKILSLSIPDAE